MPVFQPQGQPACDLQLWNVVAALHHYCNMRENFSIIAHLQTKLCLFKFAKSDTCTRPNIFELLLSKLKKLHQLKASYTYCILPVNSRGYYKRKGAATIQGRPLNLCRVPEQQCLYGTYVSDVTGNLYQIARTCLRKLMALPEPS